MSIIHLLIAAELSLVFLCAEEVTIHVEKSAAITFQSEDQRAYKLLAASDPAGTWRTIKDRITGTGGEVTIFYRSEADQKVFFKVETSDGPPGQRSLISLARLDVSERDLTGYDLEGADLREYKFYDSTLDGADLAGADLRGTGFQGASMKGADLRGTLIGFTSFDGVDFTGANLSGLTFKKGDVFLENAKFQGTILTGTHFIGADLSGASFAGVDLSGASLRGCNLLNADFTGCDLSRADLTGAAMGTANLSGANLNCLNLEGAELSGLNLSGRDLRNTNLRGVELGPASDWTGVNASSNDLTLIFFNSAPGLTGANFSGANLTGLNVGGSMPGLPGMTFNKVDFRNANLTGASFRDCDVSGCDFTGATLTLADFRGADLSGSIGFDALQAGMLFGPGDSYGNLPNDPQAKGTIMPDGTIRSDGNPGTPIALSDRPAEIDLTFNDSGDTSARTLVFSGDQFSEGVGLPSKGRFDYAVGPLIGRLNLLYEGAPKAYTLLFTSQKEGKLFQNVQGTGSTGVWLTGTFRIP
jgi:uncharacterized protein YjbI with pentapeptide repeats